MALCPQVKEKAKTMPNIFSETQKFGDKCSISGINGINLNHGEKQNR